QCSLAGAARAEQGEELALGDLDIHSVHRPHRAEMLADRPQRQCRTAHAVDLRSKPVILLPLYSPQGRGTAITMPPRPTRSAPISRATTAGRTCAAAPPRR